MHDTLAKLRSDRTSILHVCGPSGIGKSELVRQFLSTIERNGDVVALRGRCHPYETVPYRAFDGVVDASVITCPTQSETAVAGLVPRHAGAMVRLFPVLGRLPLFAEWVARDDSEDSIELRRRGFAGIRELLARLADRRRLVLWIDDIQWADPDSAALAREVFGGADPPVFCSSSPIAARTKRRPRRLPRSRRERALADRSRNDHARAAGRRRCFRAGRAYWPGSRGRRGVRGPRGRRVAVLCRSIRSGCRLRSTHSATTSVRA